MAAAQKQSTSQPPLKIAPELKPQSSLQASAPPDLLASLAQPRSARPENILRLQRLVGNRAVAGWAQRSAVSRDSSQPRARQLTHLDGVNSTRNNKLQAQLRPYSLSQTGPLVQRMQVLDVKGSKTNPLTYVGFDESEAEPPVGVPHTDGFIYSRKDMKDKEYPGYKVYLQQAAPTRKKTEAEKIKDAWDRKLAELKGNLFVGAPASGSFEYVAQEFFPSMDSDDSKQEVRELAYQIMRGPASYELIVKDFSDDALKKTILEKIFESSLSSYEDLTQKVDGADKTGAMSPEDIQKLAQGAKVKGPETVQGSLPQAIGIGYHGTNQPMSVVAGKAGEKTAQGATGWGGLQKGKDLGFKQTAFSLNAAWNPLKDKLATPSYRKGVNWDNELLSTVSAATHPTPAIKFPFPASGTAKTTTYLYAVIIEKAYPTFKIQKDPFPEVAIDKVDPEDIIGMTLVSKHYDKQTIEWIAQKMHIQQAAADQPSNELFGYYAGGFIPNFRLKSKYPQGTIDAMVNLAGQKIAEEIGPNGTWGIYDALKIKKP